MQLVYQPLTITLLHLLGSLTHCFPPSVAWIPSKCNDRSCFSYFQLQKQKWYRKSSPCYRWRAKRLAGSASDKNLMWGDKNRDYIYIYSLKKENTKQTRAGGWRFSRQPQGIPVVPLQPLVEHQEIPRQFRKTSAWMEPSRGISFKGERREEEEEEEKKQLTATFFFFLMKPMKRGSYQRCVFFLTERQPSWLSVSSLWLCYDSYDAEGLSSAIACMSRAVWRWVVFRGAPNQSLCLSLAGRPSTNTAAAL